MKNAVTPAIGIKENKRILVRDEEVPMDLNLTELPPFFQPELSLGKRVMRVGLKPSFFQDASYKNEERQSDQNTSKDSKRKRVPFPESCIEQQGPETKQIENKGD
jgi:hypothetical protein